MARRELPEFETMSASELNAMQARMLLRILVLNVLWLLVVIAVLTQSLYGGLLLLIVSALKYWFDYTDEESLTIYDAVQALLRRKAT